MISDFFYDFPGKNTLNIDGVSSLNKFKHHDENMTLIDSEQFFLHIC